MQELTKGASALGALGARIIEFDDQGAFDNLAEHAQTISGFEFADNGTRATLRIRPA